MRSPITVPCVALIAFAACSWQALAQEALARIDVDSSGVESNNGTFGVARLAANGRYAAFSSYSDNLVPNDRNAYQDVFVHDRSTGAMVRVSVSSAGNEGNFRSEVCSISADGRFVAFLSSATNLVPSDTNNQNDVFVADRDPDGNGVFDEGNATVERVSVSSSGVESNGTSGSASISADGVLVAFQSDATNLVAGDTNGAYDAFVRDRRAGTTVRISVSSSGVEGNSTSVDPVLSDDGSLVAFHSTASNLVSNDGNQQGDVFVYEMATGVTTMVTRGPSGLGAHGTSGRPVLSSDGRYVAFLSSADDLVPSDTNGRWDAFRIDRVTGQTTLLDLSAAGTPVADGVDPAATPAISDDGSRVGFVSSSNELSPGDTANSNLRDDAFVYDFATTSIELVSGDLSGHTGSDKSFSIDLSGSGRASLFQSRSDNLVPNDHNNSDDAFVLDEDLLVRAAATNYGSGLPGTFGIPALDAPQPLVFGTTATLDLGNSYGHWTVALLLGGASVDSVPLKGGTLLVGEIFDIELLPIAPTGSTLDIEVPYDPTLYAVDIYAQLLVFDPGAVRGLAFSPGLDLLIGR